MSRVVVWTGLVLLWVDAAAAQTVNPDGKVFALSFLARGVYVRGTARFGDFSSSTNSGGVDGAAITPVNEKGSIVLQYQYLRNGDLSSSRVGGGFNYFTRPYSRQRPTSIPMASWGVPGLH